MNSQRRSRVVLVLAICALLWSDPAFAALACAHTPACPQHMGLRQAGSAAQTSFARIADGKPCCPMHRQSPATPADMPSCCASGDTGAILPAVSVGHSRTKDALARLASALFASASLSSEWRLDVDTAAGYVKPIDQKKTDLRI